MNTSIEILQRNSLSEGGFAGLKEHRLVKEPGVFGAFENADGSWPGLGHFVYLADARFMPHGETRMHNHHEVDVISVIVDGRISHQGSLEHGKDLLLNDVQVQRAGGEGFSHNEINPDNEWNRMLLTRIYGGDDSDQTDFPAKTEIDVALLSKDQSIKIDEPFLAYLSRGNGIANGEQVSDGNLFRGNSLDFTATEDTQLVVVHTEIN